MYKYSQLDCLKKISLLNFTQHKNEFCRVKTYRTDKL
nr:MAG TPA: hypothetical protein [Caudoviricetes sp.]